MVNFLSMAFALILIVGCTLAFAWVGHQKLSATENEFIVYKIYVDCVEKNDKQLCQHILDKLKMK